MGELHRLFQDAVNKLIAQLNQLCLTLLLVLHLRLDFMHPGDVCF